LVLKKNARKLGKIAENCDHNIDPWSCKNVFGKEYLVKYCLISTLRKVIDLKEQFFRGSTKPLFTSQNM
jgi:hypothetical protein